MKPEVLIIRNKKRNRIIAKTFPRIERFGESGPFLEEPTEW
jgi:hypothetical protein